MTGFDIIVLTIVGVAAVGGFMRGVVQEVLSLAAWILAIAAIRVLHKPLTDQLGTQLGDTTTTSILAFVLLLLIPYAAMKVIATNAGKAARSSVLGFIDRILGFLFGAIKGLIIVVIGFSVLVLGFDTIWGMKGRPNWIATARSYEFIDASSRSMVEIIGERRARMRAADAAANEE
ncbi:CvpA family protein [Altererythrobacter aurantiacus]|uniref:CvpA family protein n=1 Tax=Parapontixanthobacter aurantiacus TaxID=1463599 RepID=A0A844ZHV8_9SPHN|nr:CvpA family protein [Parapontixanthobacter aurantiacus]MXO85309.1 CvpA family protein [Parapontixanthobacter aurantiacus]